MPFDAPAPGRRVLYRVSFDATRTTEDMVREMRARGAVVDAVSDLFGIMQVLVDDAARIADAPGVLSIKHHPVKDFW
jgi:hypothetical protein